MVTKGGVATGAFSKWRAEQKIAMAMASMTAPHMVSVSALSSLPQVASTGQDGRSAEAGERKKMRLGEVSRTLQGKTILDGVQTMLRRGNAQHGGWLCLGSPHPDDVERRSAQTCG